jgi:hypothetical protein
VNYALLVQEDYLFELRPTTLAFRLSKRAQNQSPEFVAIHMLIGQLQNLGARGRGLLDNPS